MHPTEYNPNQTYLLIVDDDVDAAEEIREIVAAHGMPAVTASNATAAIQTLESTPSIQIVVTDLYMPVFDGLDLIEKANAIRRRSQLATIVVTGRPEIDSAIRALRANVSDIVRKPIRPADLLAAIERARQALDQASTGGNGADPADSQDVISLLTRMQEGCAGMLRGKRLIDPTLDIILDILNAERNNTFLSLTSVGLGSAASPSTALRRAAELIDSNVLCRVDDPRDRRRSNLKFTDAGRLLINEWVTDLEAALDWRSGVRKD